MSHKPESLEILKRIYDAGEDVQLPTPSDFDTVPLILCASLDDYAVQAAYEPKYYKKIGDVYDALVKAYMVTYPSCMENEEMAEYSLLQDLEFCDPEGS